MSLTNEQLDILEMSEVFYNLRLYYKWCMENVKLSLPCFSKLYDIQTTLSTGGRLPPSKLLELFRGMLTLIFEDSPEGYERAQEELSGLPGYLEVHF